MTLLIAFVNLASSLSLIEELMQLICLIEDKYFLVWFQRCTDTVSQYGIQIPIMRNFFRSNNLIFHNEKSS